MARVQGKGSLQALDKPERGCKRWRMQVRCGRDHVNGGYARHTRVFHGTKTEAQKALRSYIAEVESGLRVDKKSLTFAFYAKEWMDERTLSGDIAQGTLRKNSYHIAAILPYIGNVRLSDIDADTVARLMVKLRTEGGKKGNGISGTTAHNIFVTLSHMLADAVRRNLILGNPCEKVKPPKLDTKEKRALSLEDARRLTQLLTEDNSNAHYIGALLALSCGLRREEICGLTWGDFDQAEGCIRITHALPADGKQLAPPKSDASRRIIPLDPFVLAHLSEWKTVQDVKLLGKGISQNGGCPVVCNADGGLMHPQNFARWWSRWAKKNGFEGCTLHQLRHTFATMLVANGTDMVTAADLMGHSDTTMLARVYAHLVPENASKATAAVGSALFGSRNTPVLPFASLAKGA